MMLFVGCNPKQMVETEEIRTISTNEESESSFEEPGGYVTFWFDDGLSSTYEVAYPLLSENGWKAVTALISDREIAQEKFIPDGDPIMTWNQARELAESGWEVSSHTRTHPRLNEVTNTESLQSEIILSKEDLENQGFQVHSFTFPYGQNGGEEGQEMISSNYLYWRSSLEEINPVPAWRHITSLVLTENVTKKDLEEWISRTEETGGWLVIMLHAIVDEPVNIWQHTPEQFMMVIDTVKESSLEVVLPHEMYSRFGYAEGRTPVLSNQKTALDTIGVQSFVDAVSLEIPSLDISDDLALVCEEENDYDFSVLHESPIWICPDASLYLADIGDYGASVILGHRQWGPIPKIFAELDLLEEGSLVTIKDTEVSIDFTVLQKIVIYPEELWEEIAKYHVQGIEEDRSFLIIVTCTPYGTDDMRLLAILERSNYD
jgi:LPXTG-site transpeptidase (sortase) family protein